MVQSVYLEVFYMRSDNRVYVLEYTRAYRWVDKLIYVPLNWQLCVADSQVYMEKVYFVTVYSAVKYLNFPKPE